MRSFNKEHPIFHGPFEVNISVELKPTPSEAFRFVRTDGQPLPDSLEMWRVQTKGYKTEEGFRPGMIADPGDLRIRRMPNTSQGVSVLKISMP